MSFNKWGANAPKYAVAALVAAAALFGVTSPASASASASSWCSVGGSGVTYSRAGSPAKFTSLAPMAGMNCASAQYVMNKWLRPAYARSNRLPTSFWDGYVTWTCYKRSALRWQCDEYDSGTSFRFSAYRI